MADFSELYQEASNPCSLQYCRIEEAHISCGEVARPYNGGKLEDAGKKILGKRNVLAGYREQVCILCYDH